MSFLSRIKDFFFKAPEPTVYFPATPESKEAAYKRLKTLVKFHASQGLEQNRRIAQLSGWQRHLAQIERRKIGVEARKALLAYAFVRGKPYVELELNAKKGIPPFTHLVGFPDQKLISEIVKWEKGPEPVQADAAQ